MTEFDANITRRNQRSNQIIDTLLKQMKQMNRPKVEQNLTDRALRGYVHTLNECEIKQVDPVKVNEATVSVMAAMCTELMIRTIPKGSPTLIQAAVTDLLEDFTNAVLSSIGANFDVEFELAQREDRPTPPPLLHS